ncbi:GTP-binding protein Era [Halothece sp. PCC 7418]|uniref:GTPase Era n=1 Tax=Halothece sp. (strain PCC 7418) TaxID=65093 RepID=UPI0002A065E7|nr:GTPase Era [Halothece sp. PCC 7418]AFZ43392.1 GTP-binding protein Era [Halothece sp. PCC 7418]
MIDSLGQIPVAPPNFKSGFVGLIGRPNVGKSTLMNELIGEKVAITSPVAQTTRNRLRGILTTETAQMIFVDTPGIHKPHHELGKVIVKNAQSTIEAVDLILLVVDASSPAGGGDRYIVELLKKSKVPVLVGLNKSDLGNEEKRGKNLATYRELLKDQPWELIQFSALTGVGLDSLQEKLRERLEIGPYYYPPDLVSDQPERLVMAELIREQILRETREEIPHSVAIIIDQITEEKNLTTIRATINVERASQKGILIGKKGTMLKKIGTAARAEMQKIIAGKVYLELFVRVQAKWRESARQVAEFGYFQEN